MAGRGKPGPASSGRRQQTVRFWNYEVYAAAARERGLDFTAYVNAVLAEHHGLTCPDGSTAGGQLALPEDVAGDEEHAA